MLSIFEKRPQVIKKRQSGKNNLVEDKKWYSSKKKEEKEVRPFKQEAQISVFHGPR